MLRTDWAFIFWNSEGLYLYIYIDDECLNNQPTYTYSGKCTEQIWRITDPLYVTTAGAAFCETKPEAIAEAPNHKIFRKKQEPEKLISPKRTLKLKRGLLWRLPARESKQSVFLGDPSGITRNLKRRRITWEGAQELYRTCHIGALIIRIRFWRPLYYNYNKGPLK